MNSKQFKALIKEAVREAVREEVGLILLEQRQTQLNESRTIGFTSNDVVAQPSAFKSTMRQQMENEFGGPKQQQAAPKVQAGANPYLDFIVDAGHNIQPGQGFVKLDQ